MTHPVRRAPLLAEAAATLLWARLLTRYRPFSSYKSLLAPRFPAGAAFPPVRVRAMARAIETWSRRAPATFSCLPKALALQTMLRRRGVEGRLHFGVKRMTTGKLEAHAWIVWDGQVVMGALPDLTEYSELPSWPEKN